MVTLGLFYLASANRFIEYKPEELTDIKLTIDYTSKAGKLETPTMGLELKDAVTNASRSESTPSIRQNAPNILYTKQNDYC